VCFSLPGLVLKRKGGTALVEVAGARRWYNADLHPGVQPGDHVTVHAGLVLDLLTADEARRLEEDFAAMARLADEEEAAAAAHGS
jgi:hydrogenase assembly chaperone HypC/HupF